MKTSLYLVIFSIFLSIHSFAGDCNSGFDKEVFAAGAVDSFTFSKGAVTDEIKSGVLLAAETYYDFSLGLNAESGFCIQKFYGFDHNKVLIGQDTFTRFNPITLSEKMLGIDVNFLEKSLVNTDDFIAAFKGALDFLNQRYGDGISLSNAGLELNRASLASGMSDTSFEICELGSADQCYHQAMYRLFTFSLTESPAKYLDKGIVTDFAQIIFDKGAAELADQLIRKAQETEDYIEVLRLVNPDLVIDEGEILKP